MNARLDLLAPAAGTGTAADTFSCCARYVPGADTAPSLFAELASLAESAAARVLRVLRQALQAAGASRL